MIKKTAFIIGASSEIGLATAKLLIDNNYNIIASYNNGKLDKLISYAKSKNADVTPLKLDVSSPKEIKQAFSFAFKNFDYIDSVVYCCGVCEKESLLCDMDISQIEKTIDINLKGCILCNKEASSYLIKQRHGNIVNISSIYGVYPGPCETVYAATKAGINGLTKSLALECAPYGVRVNAVAPGFIDTKMNAQFSAKDKKNIIANTPLSRLGTCEDVASAILFLTTDSSSFITGEILNVNGGATKY